MKRRTKRDVAADLVRTIAQALREGKSEGDLLSLAEGVVAQDRCDTLTVAQESMSKRYKPANENTVIGRLQAYEVAYAAATGLPIGLLRETAKRNGVQQ